MEPDTVAYEHFVNNKQKMAKSRESLAKFRQKMEVFEVQKVDDIRKSTKIIEEMGEQELV